MTDARSWVAMPAIGSGQANDPVRTKYPVQGDALLVHQQGKIYIAFADNGARDQALQNPDARLLTGEEGRQFEATLPFGGLPWPVSRERAPGGAPLHGDKDRCRTCRE